MGDEKGLMSMPTKVSELQKKVTEKHKRIVELERRLDRAISMNSEVERLTIELSKYDQGGKGSEVNPSKESSQGAAQEPAYVVRLRQEVDELRPLKSKIEEAAAALERIQQQSKAQSHHLMSLQDEAKARQIEKEDMISSMDNLQEYIGELEESRQTLAKERGQLKEQKQKLEGEIQVLKADMDQINQKMERLETALQTSQDLSKSLKVENAALTGQLQTFGSLFNENNELHAAEVSTLQEAVKKIERERDEVKSTLQATEAQLEKDELAKCNLVNVVSVKDDKTRGAGSYGSVRLVGVNGVPCIEKRLHDILLGKGRNEPVRPRDRHSLQMRFRNECILLSRINHPNIVQFMGVTYGPSPLDLTLIMEHVHMDLGKCLECYKDIPLPIKLSILLDVSYALLHLHSQHPAIIHRDLSAANVLVTPDMTAKVADLGMSRILDLESSVATAQKLTANPGALAYMAPEAQKSTPRYGTELDIFSFGAVALFVANQEFPQVYEESTVEAFEKQEIQIERRRIWLKKIGHRHCLYTLIIECLQDRPEKRPSTSDLMQRMRQLSLQYPRAFQDILQMHKEIENLQQCLSTANPSIEAERRTRSITEQIQHIRPIVDYSPDKPVYLNTDLPPTLPLDALPAQQRHLPHAAGYGPTSRPPQQAAGYGPVPKPRRQGSQNTYY